MEAKRLQELYRNRFAHDEAARNGLWAVLCRDFFSRWVPAHATVLDIAAGHCEFVNHIQAARRIAVDLNPDVVQRAGPGVQPIVAHSDDLTEIADASIDRVFISNFFEHVERSVILSTLVEVRRVIRDDGRLLVLQPNIRYCSRDYWMFFDHITPVDDRALAEAFTAAGFEVELSIPRFLPYTTKSNLPAVPRLVALYLKIPLAWRLFGGQAFMVGRPVGDRES